MFRLYWLLAIFAVLLALPGARADETTDRLRHALTLSRDHSWDDAVNALPDASALERSHLPVLSDLSQALRLQRPAAAAHLLAAMRRLDPEAVRPRTALETLWADNPALDGLWASDVDAFPVVAETDRIGGVTIVTLAPGPFLKTPPVSEPATEAVYPLYVNAYVESGSKLTLRFIVHMGAGVSDALARRTGRFLTALSGLTDSLLGPSNRASYPVPVWLAADGKPGANQWRGAIHVSATNTPRTGIEWARELAHEWGHACLPGIDGFTQPEAWANGDLGERLFLPMMARASRLDAWEPGLDATAYSLKYVSPLSVSFERSGPDDRLLSNTGRAGYEHFLASALYIGQAYGPQTLIAALDGAGGGSARDFLHAFEDVLASRPGTTVNRWGAPGPRPICIPRTGRYTLDGRIVRLDGRPLKTPSTLKAGWVQMEWEGILTVRRVNSAGARPSSRNR